VILRGIFAIDVSLGWQELEEYLKTTEKYLEKAKTDWETSFNEQVKHLPPEERDELGEFYSDTYWDYAETFPAILRNSFLVSAYSMLEHKLVYICYQLRKEFGLSHSWNDARGTKLEQFKKCCNKAHLPLSFASQDWQEIKNYSLVRNCIVHNNGLMKGFREEQKLRIYTNSKKIISQNLIRQQITLTEQFCKEVIKTMRAFLSKVIEAYESQKQKQKPET